MKKLKKLAMMIGAFFTIFWIVFLILVDSLWVRAFGKKCKRCGAVMVSTGSGNSLCPYCGGGNL